MKKTSKRIILGVFMACLCSCSNDVIETIEKTNEETNEETNDEGSCTTRYIVAGNEVSVSNPTFINDWENTDIITLNSGERTTVPWSPHGTEGTLSETFRRDIKKEDGWKMIFHTFKEVGFRKEVNYIFFYNLFTGYVKVFYYCENTGRNQGTQWYIKTSNGQKVKLLDEPTYLSKLESEPASNNQLLLSNMAQNPAYGVEGGWNGFEFPITRYCSDLTSFDFFIGAYDKTITEFSIFGNADFTTVGTITTTSAQTPGIHKVVSNLVGPEAKGFIDKLGKKIFGNKVVFGKKITKLIGSIPSSGYASAITGGLNMIFGRTTTTSTSDVKLTTTGQITLSGSSSTITTNNVRSLSFNLYDVLNAKSTHNSNPGIVPGPGFMGGGHHIGVWTLKKNPIVYYDRITLLSNWKKIGESDDGKRVLIQGHTYLPPLKRYEIEPVINPNLIPYIKEHSFTVEFVPCDRIDGKPYKGGGPDINYYSHKHNILYADDDLCLWETSEEKLYDMEFAVLKTNNIEPLCYYYDWGNIRRGQLVAVVTLHVTYWINGKEKNISQSQIYDVDYGVDTSFTQPDDVHHPPYVVVANYNNPYAGGNILGYPR